MAEARALNWRTYPVRPVRFRLVHVHFSDNESVSDEECEEYAQSPDLYEQVFVARPSAVELSVAIEVLTGEDAPLNLRVTYAVDFEVDAGIAEQERDEALAHTAYYLAPRTIYPYLREFVSNLTLRWRGGEITLPYFPLPLHLPEGQGLVIPDPPESEDVYKQTEIPLEDVVNERAETSA